MGELAHLLGSGSSGFHAFPDDLSFKLGKRRQDVEHEPPVRSGGVDAVPDTDEMLSLGFKLVDMNHQVLDGTSEAIQLGDYDAVGFLGFELTQQLLKAGSFVNRRDAWVAVELEQLVSLELAPFLDLLLLVLTPPGAFTWPLVLTRTYPKSFKDCEPVLFIIY